MSDIRVTVWNEFRHENSTGGAHLSDGLHIAIAEGLKEHGITNVRTAALDEPDNGLPAEALAPTCSCGGDTWRMATWLMLRWTGCRSAYSTAWA